MSLAPRLRALRSASFFATVPVESLALVAEVAREVTCPAGGTVVNEGDVGDGLYVVVSGDAQVQAAGADGNEIVLARLGPGDVFGEQYLLAEGGRRSASVRCRSEAHLLHVRTEEYRALLDRHPELTQALWRRGGRFDDARAALGIDERVERTWRCDDGRTFASTHLVRDGVFRLERTPPCPTAVEHAFAADGLSRAIRLDSEGRIVGLLGIGPWGRLPTLIEAALGGTPLTADQLASFPRTGALYLPPPPKTAARPSARTICFCTQVSRGAIQEEIGRGCRTFEELRQRTGCGSVCGGCEPAVKELLGHAEWTPVTVTEVAIREDIRCFRLHPKGGWSAAFHPGQHVVIEGYVDGDWIARAYTIISAPGERDHVEVCVKREPYGLFSAWLFSGELDAKALQISAPRGELRWEPTGRPTVCLVAGIGITPALAILRAALATTERVHIDYSARAPVPFLDELEAAACDRITVRIRTTDRDGRITPDELAELARAFPDADFWVCGPDGYMASVEWALTAAGITRIRRERFAHAGPPTAPPPAAPPSLPPPPARRSPRVLALVGACAILFALWYLGTR